MIKKRNINKDPLFSVTMRWKHNQVPFGQVNHSSLKTPVSFSGTASLLYLVSGICDVNDYPPLFASWRTMLDNPDERRLLRASVRKKSDYSVNFALTLIERRNFTMRGFIEFWDKQFLFRSGMEFEGYLLDMMMCVENPALLTVEDRIPPERKMR